MAFDLNKNAGKKKFDLSKSTDTAAEIGVSKEKKSPTSRPDLKKKEDKLISKPALVKKKEESPVHALTKDKASTASANAGKKKPALVIFSLLGIAVLAVVIWYFIASDHTERAPDHSPAKSTARPSSPAAVNNSNDITTSTPAGNVPASTEIKNSTLVAPSSVDNKVLANFEPGSALLISVDEITIKSITSYLSQNEGSKLTVYGFASSEGDFSFNEVLSQQRADACKNYLVGKGISSDRILTIGKGIENPISSNDTEEGRMKNRRVEIVLD